MLEVGVLGPLRLMSSGSPVEVRRARERGLLSLLVMEKGQTLSPDQLLNAVWGENLPSNPSAALQTGISRLRKVVGPDVIVTSAAGYAVDPSQVDIDVERFERQIEAVPQTAPGERVQLIDQALGLWRGTPYAEFAYAEFAQAEIRRLEELRLNALEARAAALLETGLSVEAIPQLQSLVTEYPLRESLWGWLMLALYRAGRQADALRAFREARSHLIEQLGIEPGTMLHQLEEQILTQDPALDSSFVPVDSVGDWQPPSFLRLPNPLTRLIGRDEDLELLVDQLRTSRLVTVTGPVGVGKSRLAIEAAHRVAGDYSDGAVYLDIESYDKEAGVDGIILATSRGLDVSGDIPEQLFEVLRGRSRLILADGCEPFIEDFPSFTAALLGACPEIAVLATSRESFGLTGEAVHSLRPLPVTQNGTGPSPAVDLFRERVHALNPHLEFDEITAEAAARIVASLDGLPLAIELAASQTVYLSMGQLADQLESENRELVSRDPTVSLRHRSLHAAVEVSWGSLSADQKRTMEAICFLQSPWTLDTAAEMTGRPISEGLEAEVYSLVNRSLVTVQGNESDSTRRFSLLRTIREFGREKAIAAGHETRLHERHARALGAFAHDIGDKLIDVGRPLQAYWDTVAEVEERLVDIEVALRWLLDNDAESAIKMVAKIGMFWLQTQRNSEGERWFRASLEGDQRDSADRAEVMAMLGEVIRPGAYVELDALTFSHPFSNWRDSRRYHANDAARADEAVRYLSDSIGMFDRLGVPEQTFTRLDLARSLAIAGDTEGAYKLVRSILKESENLTDDAVCYAEQIAARVAISRGDLEAAASHARRGNCSDLGHLQTIFGIDTLGQVSLARGDWHEAAANYTRLLDEYAEPNRLPGSAICHLQLSYINAVLGDPESCLRHAGEALKLSRRFEMPRIESSVRFTQAWAYYVADDLEAATEYALHSYDLAKARGDAFGFGTSLLGLGVINNRLGQPDSALQRFRSFFLETDGLAGRARTSGGLFWTAHSFFLLGRFADAARLLGAAHAARERVPMPWVEGWAGIPEPGSALEEVLGAASLQLHYQEGREMGLEEAVQLILSE